MKKILILLALAFLAFSCREDEMIVISETDTLPVVITGGVSGMYMLNEGNMGSNKCTLDFLDFQSATYLRNIYAERNPMAVKELGDVGNDIGCYGSKVYIVVNCSHKVEVIDAHSAQSLGHIDIPNGRFVRFYRGKAYVSSYVGPVSIGDDSPLGAIYEIDTLSLEITRRATVGYQPEEFDFDDNYIYVANSGGYRPPLYDRTVSVVDLATMRQIRQIDVAPNLCRLRRDSSGRLWVSSRGDNSTSASCIFMLEKNEKGWMEVSRRFDIPCSNFALTDDMMYFISSQWDSNTLSTTIDYGSLDLNTLEIQNESFISDGTDKYITRPYGIAIHPGNGDIYLTDAKNYVSSGTLYCFSSSGVKKWSVRTGDIPASMCFIK